MQVGIRSPLYVVGERGLAMASESEPNQAQGHRRSDWVPPADVITGCLVGCLLPVVAYAQAMSALFGFGFADRKWAALLFAVPTAAWVGAFGLGAVVFLAPQLAIAAAVSALMWRFGAGRRRAR